jgi:hypothetical protein
MGHGGRRPGAGRPKGSLNKRSMEKADAIEASGMTPLDFMIEVMRNRSNSAEMRLEAAKSAAPYVHARLHAAEIAEPDDDLVDEEDIVARIEAILAANPELKKLITGIENERDGGGKVVALHPGTA